MSKEFAVANALDAKKRIQGYMEDPLIGQEKVESFLDNLHAIKYKCNMVTEALQHVCELLK